MEWDSQRSSVSSNPNSVTSQQYASTTNQRTDKVPTLQQISPSPSVSALSKLTDDDLRRKGIEDVVRILRKVESDYKSLLGEHGHIVKDVNRRYQIFLLESRGLKEVNQKLQDDNQELRDLCCFLDDDRQRGRKLAREWQRFGRYTASVMRSEVAVYQEKLQELEERQCELVKENVELKELCLFLDQERGRITGDRDEGDGSSNGTIAGQEDGIIPMETSSSNTQSASIIPPGPTSSGSTNYIRELEQKVQKLEDEKKLLSHRMNRNNAEGLDESSRDRTLVHDHAKADESLMQGLDGSKSPKPRKPEAVVDAMKVLNIHEELEKTPTEEENLDDTEKAIVREMCNVVWRKLGDVGDVGSFNDSSDSILDPPAVPSPGSSLPVNPIASQGQSHPFTISQPQPQMASTPLSSYNKPTGGDQIHGNQKHHPERQAKNPPPANPLRPSQAANQAAPFHQMPPHHQTDVSSRKHPYGDGRESKMNKADDDHRIGDQERLARAYPFSMPQPFPRPSSQPPPPQPRDSKPVTSHHLSSHSQPGPQLRLSSEENLPPHFQSHRHRSLQQQQHPQPQTQHPHQQQQQHHQQPQTQHHHQQQHQQQHHQQPQTQHPHQQPQQHQYFNSSQNATNNSRKSPGPVPDKVHPHHAPSSTPSSVPYQAKPPYQHTQQLTSSQQYPHHPVQLLDAPGSQSHRGPEPRTARDDNNPHGLNKRKSSHQEGNFARKDSALSEPNVSSPVMYRGARDLGDNRETSSSHMALRPALAEQDRKGPPILAKPMRGGQSVDGSSGQHLSGPPRGEVQGQYHDRAGPVHPSAHPVKGGFLAYPRSVQAPMLPHSGSTMGGSSRTGYSQPGDMISRAPGNQSHAAPKIYPQQEWRQTYLDDSDTL